MLNQVVIAVLVGTLLQLACSQTVQLDSFGDNSIRVRIAPPGAAIADPELRALLPQAPSLRHGSPASVSGAGPLRLTNGNLQITAAGGRVIATRVSDGKVLLVQNGLSFGQPLKNANPSFYSGTATFIASPEERIYGLGEHRNGKVQQFGFEKDFRDSQFYPKSHGADVMIPYYGSTIGYGFLWVTASYGNVSLTNKSLSWSMYASPNIDFWITTTPATTDPAVSPLAYLLNNYVDVVGHAAPLPFYASGFWQCKNRYRQQDQLLEVARGYVSRGLPISIIVIDYMHWEHFGDWSFNPTCWPDVQGMVNELSSMGIELAVTFWPMVTPQGAYFNSFNESGFFFADYNTGKASPIESWAGAMYCTDETNPAARTAIFDAFWKGYGQYGIKTLWLDGSEPERSASYNYGDFRLYAGSDMEVGEAWVREHARAIQVGMATKGIAPNEFVTLARSSWSGSPAMSSAVWSGDISSTFDELAIQIKNGQTFALSGQALWTTDIGGYGGGNPQDPVFQELIVRWFQFGAFCPLFRLHGQRQGGPPSNECGETGGDNEVWNLAPDPQHYQGIVRVMELREDLRNYVMKINKESVETGMPMMRAMALAFPNDPAAQTADVEDQFMFGPSWLVAPVYVHQATSRSVYLPIIGDHNEWVYWWNQSIVFSGGQRVTMATPIDEFPLFLQRPTIPLQLTNMSSLFSPIRLEQVLCVSELCFHDQVAQGNYSAQRTEGRALISSSGSVDIHGQSYRTLPLNLYFTFTHTDNYVSTRTSPPDSTYSLIGNNGYVLAEQAPGSVPLGIWFKQLAGQTWDYATIASTAGQAWATANGYKFVENTGFVFPA